LDSALALSDSLNLPGGNIANELTIMAAARKREKWKSGNLDDQTSASLSGLNPADPV